MDARGARGAMAHETARDGVRDHPDAAHWLVSASAWRGAPDNGTATPTGQMQDAGAGERRRGKWDLRLVAAVWDQAWHCQASYILRAGARTDGRSAVRGRRPRPAVTDACGDAVMPRLLQPSQPHGAETRPRAVCRRVVTAPGLGTMVGRTGDGFRDGMLRRGRASGGAGLWPRRAHRRLPSNYARPSVLAAQFTPPPRSRLQ